MVLLFLFFIQSSTRCEITIWYHWYNNCYFTFFFERGRNLIPLEHFVRRERNDLEFLRKRKEWLNKPWFYAMTHRNLVWHVFNYWNTSLFYVIYQKVQVENFYTRMDIHSALQFVYLNNIYVRILSTSTTIDLRTKKEAAGEKGQREREDI